MAFSPYFVDDFKYKNCFFSSSVLMRKMILQLLLIAVNVSFLIVLALSLSWKVFDL